MNEQEFAGKKRKYKSDTVTKTKIKNLTLNKFIVNWMTVVCIIINYIYYYYKSLFS